MTSAQLTSNLLLEKNKSLLSSAHLDYSKELNKHSYFKIHNRALSEDLVQDTFIKTWHYLIKGGEIILMKAFLYHILNNLIIDEYRKKKSVSLDELLDNGFEPRDNNSDSLFNILDGKEAILLIKKLPTKYRDVIYMRYVQDLSLEEISLVTCQTKNTNAVQIYRGLEKLRSIYKHQLA